MTQLTREDILKLAQLAKLKLNESEVEAFRSEITEILGYVEMLKDVDTNGLEPTYQVTGLANVMRPDEIKESSATTKDLLRNVPRRDDDYIKVNRMIG